MCFFNAVIQCLLYSPSLSQLFLEHRERKQLNTWSKEGTWGEVTLAVGDFVRVHLSPTANHKDNMALYNVMSRWHHAYYQQQQQDAH